MMDTLKWIEWVKWYNFFGLLPLFLLLLLFGKQNTISNIQKSTMYMNTSDYDSGQLCYMANGSNWSQLFSIKTEYHL